MDETAASAAPITFTLDLEDHRPSSRSPVRYPDVTRRLLDDLDGAGVRGTVFVVGQVAQEQPDLVREVAARGHEIGLHGWRHVPLTQLDPPTLRADAARGRALLEDLAQQPVRGFRAPIFSIVPASRWATDVLADLGFAYSSSALPAHSPLFGDASLPAHPFRWPSGLVELPGPVARVRGVGIPFLGGTYLRAVPEVAVRALLGAIGDRQLLWSYCHPYDFDAGEEFWSVPGLGWAGSKLLWYRRRGAQAKLLRLLAGRAGAPLGERAAGLDPPTLGGPGGALSRLA